MQGDFLLIDTVVFDPPKPPLERGALWLLTPWESRLSLGRTKVYFIC